MNIRFIINNTNYTKHCGDVAFKEPHLKICAFAEQILELI